MLNVSVSVICNLFHFSFVYYFFECDETIFEAFIQSVKIHLFIHSFIHCLSGPQGEPRYQDAGANIFAVSSILNVAGGPDTTGNITAEEQANITRKLRQVCHSIHVNSLVSIDLATCPWSSHMTWQHAPGVHT